MKTTRQKRLQIIIALLAIAFVACFMVQYATVSAYNQELHVSTGQGDDQSCAAGIQHRGGQTGSWYKMDTGLTGQTFDATISNKTSDLVSSWTLTIDIVGDCYLNQFWNGTVEIHQHVNTDEELVQTLDLADYDPKALQLEYFIDGSDLLIPLTDGDYIVYHPSKEFSEMPLESGEDTIVGVIFYHLDGIDLSNYHVDYYCHRDFTEGIPFIILVVIGALLVLVIVSNFVAEQAYRQAEKEQELRKSGLTGMSELYAVIYLIDLGENTITPIGVDEREDALRPRELPPNEQLENLFRTDAKPAYMDLAVEFSDLDTIPDRLKDRNSIVFEYESKEYGWCRIRFIAMDRSVDKRLERVLFTIEQINEEKQELSKVIEQAEREHVANVERGVLLGGVAEELQTSFGELVAINEVILRESTQENVLRHANDLHDKASSLQTLVDNTADYFKVQSGKMEITHSDYSLKALILDAARFAQTEASNAGVDFTVEATQSLPDQLNGDGQKLSKVVVNLLDNAIGSAEGHRVKLSVFGKVVDDETVHLLVSVSVSGNSATTPEQLQQPSFSEGAPSEVEAEDVSMGLAKALISLMGSKLGIADVYAGGKDYYFELEQTIVDAAPIGPIDLSESELGAR